MNKYNPFNPNSIVATNLFAGRTRQTLDILNKLNQVKMGMPASFFIFGERGIGKTALAKLIKYVIEQNDPQFNSLNFLTSYYSAEKNQSISSILQASLNELTDSMPKSIMDKLGEKLGSIFKNGKFSIGAFLIGVELDTHDEEQETSELKDLIISILTNILLEIKNKEEDKNAKNGILFIIDEVDNVSDINICAQLFRGITATLDVKGLGFVAFLLIGYERTIKNFFKGDPSARRQFDIIELGVMPTNEAKEVLTKGFQEAKVSWDEKALEENIFVAGGYPHSIQMIGHNLIEEDDDKNISQKDWREAIGMTANDLKDKDFAGFYNFRGKSGVEELILDILAIKGEPLTRNEIKKYSGGKNIYQYIPNLIKNGSVRELKQENKLTLYSQLFRTSILLHILPRITHEHYLSDLLLESEQSDTTNNKS